MKEPSCSSCGSSSLNLFDDYYICNHCHSKFTIPKEDNKREDKPLLSFRVKIFIAFIILNILVLNYYFFIYKQDVIEKPKVVKMEFWNNVYDWKFIEEIDDLQKTNRNTYLISSKGIVAELDANGNELWHKDIPSIDKQKTSKIIDLEDGYLISMIGYWHSHEKKTIKLNRKKEIVFTLPYSFSSMVASGKEFVGISQNKAIRIDKRGNIVWEKVLNDETYLKKAGRTRASNGKLVRFKITAFKVEFDQLVELKDGSFIALGESYNSNLETVKFSKDGKVIWKKTKKIDKIYNINDAIATKDGGYILTVGTNLRIFKFDKNGKLQFEYLAREYKEDWVDAIIEVDDGYIISSTIESAGNILILKLSLDAKVMWKKKILRHKNRLHVENIVKAFDGGFLLGVRIEANRNWLVKMSDTGEIKTQFEDINNLNNITRYIVRKKKKNKLKLIDNIFTYRGSRCQDIIPSKSNKYLYTLVGRSGFKIFDIRDKNNFKEAGSFIKTRLNLKINSDNVYAPSHPYGGEGEYQYDFPISFRISSDEQKAYISDINFGFYILDISDKKKLRQIGFLPNCKIKYFVLSKKEDRIFSYNANKIISLDLRDTSFLKREFQSYYHPFNSNHNGIEISKSSDFLYVTDKNTFKVFSVKDFSLINSYKASRDLGQIRISENEKLAYILMYKSILVIDISDEFNYKLKNTLLTHSKNSISSFNLLDDSTILYTDRGVGVKVLDISDPQNTKITEVFSDESKLRAYTMNITEDKNKLYIGLGSRIGSLDLEAKR